MPFLSWLTRDGDIRAVSRVPYRLLEEVPALSAGDPAAGNMLTTGCSLPASSLPPATVQMSPHSSQSVTASMNA